MEHHGNKLCPYRFPYYLQSLTCVAHFPSGLSVVSVWVQLQNPPRAPIASGGTSILLVVWTLAAGRRRGGLTLMKLLSSGSTSSCSWTTAEGQLQPKLPGLRAGELALTCIPAPRLGECAFLFLGLPSIATLYPLCNLVNSSWRTL